MKSNCAPSTLAQLRADLFGRLFTSNMARVTNRGAASCS